MHYWVHILASRKHGTLYIGVTNDVACRRINGWANGSRGQAPGRQLRTGWTVPALRQV